MRLRRLSRNKGVALASALFFSFGVFQPQAQETIQESKDETRRKKDAQSGDPPTTG